VNLKLSHSSAFSNSKITIFWDTSPCNLVHIDVSVGPAASNVRMVVDNNNTFYLSDLQKDSDVSRNCSIFFISTVKHAQELLTIRQGHNIPQDMHLFLASV